MMRATLRQLREQRGMTQLEVAHKAGLTVLMVRKMERLDIRTLERRLSAIVGYDVMITATTATGETYRLRSQR